MKKNSTIKELEIEINSELSSELGITAEEVGFKTGDFVYNKEDGVHYRIESIIDNYYLKVENVENSKHYHNFKKIS
ncbi:MAG: hypothetical protein H7A23_05360 [Leptospiraceae bacterium]|nr:hypothetical protein [Leptospiraceae bacterium]MCP5493964.1 hypothetical protein [Leptospiraceae bacterium]